MSGKLFEFNTEYTWEPVSDQAFSHFHDWRNRGVLGYFDLPCMEDMHKNTREKASAYSRSFDNLFVAGIGGSSLGLRAILAAEGLMDGNVSVLDSPDSRAIRKRVEERHRGSSAICVITKSGGTAETLSIFMELRKLLGSEAPVIAITDPQKGELRKLAETKGWDTLPVPSNVGGRFSVLSPVGLLPAAFAGADTEALISGAHLVRQDFLDNGPDSLAGRIAGGFLSRFKTHPIHVFMPYDDSLYQTSLWFAQLWAESLGKALNLKGETVNTGQTPLPCRGPADQHSLVQLFMEGPADKAITFVSSLFPDRGLPADGEFSSVPTMGYLQGRDPDELRAAEADATAEALQERGLPVSRIVLPEVSGYYLGQMFMALETATVLSGLALGIDPLDQPGVERGKILTYRAMGREGF